MAIAFTFDGGSAMTNQPARIDVAHRQPPQDVAVNGGDLGISWTKNRVITVTWKDDTAHGTMAELVAARNSKRGHAITWNDPAGTGQSASVSWPTLPDYTQEPGGGANGHFAEITVVFYERPD